jgi:hypothetical protein
MLPPGRARLATSPSPTGSTTPTKTTGTETVVRLTAIAANAADARTISILERISSSASPGS